MLIARVVLRAFGTVFSKSLSITTLGVGAFVVRCSFRRSLSDHDSRLARLWFGASFRRSLSDHHSRLARLWFGAVLPLSVGAFVVRSVSERPSRELHRCQMPRGHAPARFRSESSVRAVVVDESPTVCASDMSLGEATYEESGLECTFQSCMVQC